MTSFLTRFCNGEQNDFSKHWSPCHFASKNTCPKSGEFFWKWNSLPAPSDMYISSFGEISKNVSNNLPWLFNHVKFVLIVRQTNVPLSMSDPWILACLEKNFLPFSPWKLSLKMTISKRWREEKRHTRVQDLFFPYFITLWCLAHFQT